MEEKHNTTKRMSRRNRQEKDLSQTAVQSRRRFRKEKNKEHDETKDQPPKKTRWVQIRLFPIWLRVILVILLIAGFAALGAYVGYSVIGDGDSTEIFEKETWTHIIDIIKGVE